MVNITLSVPEDLKREMEKFPEMNWSVIFREVIRKRLMLLKQIKEFSRDSELTEEDAIRIGRKINKSLHERYERMRKKEEDGSGN